MINHEILEGDRRWPTLMAAAQDGDAEAYRVLLRELLPAARALVRRQRVHPSHVEDVLQDTLLALHRVRATYDPRLPFLPWVAAIVRRRAIDWQRRNGRRDAHEDSASDDIVTYADPTSNRDVERREWSEVLARAVAELPPKQKMALEMVKLREMSVAEAAAASGQTEGAVKVNVHRAIRALRELLEEDR